MMGDEDPHGVLGSPGKCLAGELDLALADPAVLERQRARGIDSQHCDAGQFEERTQGVVDEPAVAGQWRKEAAKHVVERNVVVARYAQDFVAAFAQPLEEAACLLELIGRGALGEVAADHDQVGPELVDARLDRLDESRVVRPKVKIGQVDEAGHETPTTSC